MEFLNHLFPGFFGCLTLSIILEFQKAFNGFVFLPNSKFVFARYSQLLYNESDLFFSKSHFYEDQDGLSGIRKTV